MSVERQLTTQQLLTKKVAQAVRIKTTGQDAQAVKSEWDQTLDDLIEDPDFAEVYLHLPKSLRLLKPRFFTGLYKVCAN